ncbi:uncharacterized protein [Gossypium hirsutum]|uniref:Uncharacterized protein isoform X2 n=1 Tax=Gossypium hirsutum TaxID=3635 RepID=A0ABM3AQA6_GOSHI|nr:uncharacterized protein LOC107890735 isoform X2 [Gossypium hirsutum]
MSVNNSEQNESMNNETVNPAFEVRSDVSKSFTAVLTNKISLLIDESNFLSWKQHVYLTLKTHRLQSYVEGTIAIPPRVINTDSGVQIENPAFVSYEQQDSALASWLMSSVSPSLHTHLVGLHSAFEIWNKLNQIFALHSRTKRMQYRCMLHNVKKQDKTMREYLAEIKHICDVLSGCGQNIHEEQQSAILNGLPIEYENIVSIITSSQHPYDLQGVVSALLDAEARIKLQGNVMSITANVAVQQQLPANSSDSTKSNDQTLNSSSEGMNVQTRPYYQGNGGFRPRGRGERYSNNSRPQCQLCGKIGHLVSKCFHRFNALFTGISDSTATNSQSSNYVKPSEGVNGFYCYPGPTTGFTMFSPQVGHPGFTGLNTQGNLAGSGGLNVSAHIPSTGMPPTHAGYTQASSEGNRISQCLQATPAVVVDPAWYPDTGATGHLTHDSTCLQHSNPATGIVQVGNGSCIPIINTGIATFSTDQKELHLNKLFYAPNITKNLISVSQFTKDNNVSFEFFPNIVLLNISLRRLFWHKELKLMVSTNWM